MLIKYYYYLLLILLLLNYYYYFIDGKKLLFAHFPGTLAYYDEYMKELKSHYDVIWYPKCKLSDVASAIVKHNLEHDDVVFFQSNVCESLF